MHGRVFSCAVAALRIYVGITRNMDKNYRSMFPNSFSNLVQDEHDNVIEACLCVAVPVAMLRNNFLPRTAKHQLT
jgi:hypothetical protein